MQKYPPEFNGTPYISNIEDVETFFADTKFDENRSSGLELFLNEQKNITNFIKRRKYVWLKTKPYLEIKKYLLVDASNYISASLLQYLAHKKLQEGGFITWMQVTRYYSRFFAIKALVKLAGNSLIYFRTAPSKKREQLLLPFEDGFLIFPCDSDIAKYFGFKVVSGSHNINWRLFYWLFSKWKDSDIKRYSILPGISKETMKNFGIIEDFSKEDLSESNYRNWINYDFSGFFTEIWGASQMDEVKPGANLFSTHNHILETDPEETRCWHTMKYSLSLLSKTPFKKDINTRMVPLVQISNIKKTLKEKILQEVKKVSI